MRADDLDHEELLELDPQGGLIRFAGQRALLIDAVAMGLLRKYLVENFGRTAARTVLTQFGFAHGWRMAEALKAEYEWETEDDWRRAGTRIHALEGLFRVELGSDGPLSEKGAMLVASYEAEQHLLHFGRDDVPVCWTLSGLISGYVSRAYGKEIYVLEDRCLGKGDAACHLIGKTRQEWGDERGDELLFFVASRLQECLDVSLHRVTETLKAAEKKLRQHRRVLVRVEPTHEPLGIVTTSKAMRDVVDLARRVAKFDSTVIIAGESGSGKERIARLVHDESTRAGGPFVAVNCGAITETLLESELFGHTRGAFTGASQDRPGLFEAANNGTLLLDEVGELSPGMQVKLLRVLQEREVRRVGENRSRKVDVRVVAATNKNLLAGVTDGTFRQDLYYRLRVVELHVPPLRQRRDDILPLARVLLAEASLRMKRKISGLAPEVADQLLRYDWPGNVRELENVMERAVALAHGSRVEREDLPEEVREAFARPVATADTVQTLEDTERDYILAVLALNDGNQARTASQLKIGSATLYRKLKRYGVLDAKSPEPPSDS
jgi:two-component system, NtrC family, response regulator HydG